MPMLLVFSKHCAIQNKITHVIMLRFQVPYDAHYLMNRSDLRSVYFKYEELMSKRHKRFYNKSYVLNVV